MLDGTIGEWFVLTIDPLKMPASRSSGRPRPILLLWVLALGVIVIATVFAAASIYSASRTVQVTVLNDQKVELRLSGCVDDADDLSGGATASIDVPKRVPIGCNVFSFGAYEGCLVLRDSDAVSRAARVARLSSLDRHIDQAACENI